jgi:hypothetical protein
MLLASLDRRVATAIRLAGLVLVAFSVLNGSHPPGTSGRGLVVGLLLAAAALSWLVWTARPNNDQGAPVELYVMAASGGLLVEAAPQSAASVFVFVAVIVSGLRMELARATRLPMMRRILVTGMSGTGKSSALEGLRLLGFRTIDTDEGEWTEWSEAEGGYVWRDELMAELLARDDGPSLYVSGTVSNQGRFYSRFDAVAAERSARGASHPQTGSPRSTAH